MRRYSYFFLQGGRIIHSETRRFTSDDCAIRLAKLLTKYSNAEVWENERLVARLTAEAGAKANPLGHTAQNSFVPPKIETPTTH